MPTKECMSPTSSQSTSSQSDMNTENNEMHDQKLPPLPQYWSSFSHTPIDSSCIGVPSCRPHKEKDDNHDLLERACQHTVSYLCQNVDQFIETAVSAFHCVEKKQREMKLLRDDCLAKQNIIAQLTISEHQNRIAIAVRKMLHTSLGLSNE
jgi:hypothetical protein